MWKIWRLCFEWSYRRRIILGSVCIDLTLRPGCQQLAPLLALPVALCERLHWLLLAICWVLLLCARVSGWSFGVCMAAPKTKAFGCNHVVRRPPNPPPPPPQSKNTLRWLGVQIFAPAYSFMCPNSKTNFMFPFFAFLFIIHRPSVSRTVVRAEDVDYEAQFTKLQKEAEERLDEKVEELMKNIETVGQN